MGAPRFRRDGPGRPRQPDAGVASLDADYGAGALADDGVGIGAQAAKHAAGGAAADDQEIGLAILGHFADYLRGIAGLNQQVRFDAATLPQVLQLFPREQILVLSSEELKRDPDETLGAICDFLGIPAPTEPIRPRISRAAADIAYPSELADEDVIFLQRYFVDEMLRFDRLRSEAPLR